MTGDELRRFRERRLIERAELAELLNESLGTRYRSDTVARWENPDADRGGKVPRKVAAFLETLALEHFAAGASSSSSSSPAGLEDSDEPLEPQPAADSAPGAGPSALPQPQVGGGAWSRACEELWELVATGVGMVGAATNNPALVNDGAIIAGDKKALGAAWGRLAETNETFRKMLVGMTEGGAWLQVAMVTGTTLSKCWQGHQAYAAHAAREAAELNGTAGVERDEFAA